MKKIKKSVRAKKTTKGKSKTEEQKVVVVSGGFDPVHIGHVRMFNEAKKLGHKLVVILNNDNWLRKKKGYVFMPQHERLEVILGFRAVDEVHLTEHPEDPTDMSVCEALKKVRPHVFANGGDRVHDNIPEVSVCREIGAEMVFQVGHGGKVQSSSWLVGKLKEKR
jgi:cytidyltransferase-like protein